MPEVRYQISATKNYSYQNGILVNAPIGVNISFTANVPDPNSAGLTPYYRSSVGGSDSFFQNMIAAGGLKFVSSSVEPSLGQDRDNNYSAWTETYSRIEKEQTLFDTVINVSMPVWRLNFVNLVDHDDVTESRRLRQAYGYTVLSGSITVQSKTRPGTWKDVFQSYDEDKFIVENATITEGWQNGELLYTVNVGWKAYDLSNLPQFRENL